jgi:serine/threonine protein kinase
MPCTAETLAHHEIASQLGKGSMGEVFRAKDQKLGRDVAIKVLPEEFARDTDLVARFQREAKLLASLIHPNIASIYGLEKSDGTKRWELADGAPCSSRIWAIAWIMDLPMGKRLLSWNILSLIIPALPFWTSAQGA